MVQHVQYEPKGAAHYNVKFKTGALLHRVTAPDICGFIHQNME
jgi:hypothetical protein